MCGIAGIISQNPHNISISKLKQMTDILSHRGPDGEGQWISDNGKVGFGHRRLSIIDLSDAGKQPMHYLNGRYTITFNGEIYNYLELKTCLEKQGYSFVSDSDTEVLMAMYDSKKERCLEDLDGMFSFVISDNQEQTIFIARDRFGEKPFFYYMNDNTFYFASEMKALWTIGVEKKINNKMLYNYLLYSHVNNPNDLKETFYESILSLEASFYIKFNIRSMTIQPQRYWKLDYQNQNENISLSDVTEQFKYLFNQSVMRRLRSDVSVGSSLSGGLDSSLIVCTIDELIKEKDNGQEQQTFSACFPGFIKDESYFMHKVIEKTNAKPNFVYPNAQFIEDNVKQIMYYQEEPFPTASICIQYAVMMLAKQKGVTVLLDGQGADEILGGYHSSYDYFFKELEKKSKTLYREQYKLYLDNQKANQKKLISYGDYKFFFRRHIPTLVPNIKKLYAMYSKFISNDVSKTFFNENKENDYHNEVLFDSLNESLAHHFNQGALQQLLRYADRNSMAHSREVRLPYLSHELVQFMFKLPSKYKINDGWTKWLMRYSFSDLLPHEIAWRRDKVNYSPPQEDWMKKKSLGDAVKDNINFLISANILDKKAISNTDTNKQWKYWTVGLLLQ